MKNTRLQDPKTKKTPRSKHQRATVSYLVPVVGNGVDDVPSWMFHGGGEAGGQKLHPFDLEERTARFGERIIRFVKRVPRGPQFPENNRLVDQLVGAGTSIGANYCEANEDTIRYSSIIVPTPPIGSCELEFIWFLDLRVSFFKLLT